MKFLKNFRKRNKKNTINPFKNNRTHLSETYSTSGLLKEKMTKKQLAEYTSISTDYQTAGRGQRGNHWESSRNKNLLFSFLLRPTFLSPTQQFYIAEIIALALKKTLEQYTSDISIKWPNDLYWKNKKIAGILIEHEISSTAIQTTLVGIGLNVNQNTFRSDAPNPISLKQILGKEYDKEKLLQLIFKQIESYYQRLRKNKQLEISQEYHTSLYQKDLWCTYKDKNGTFKGKIIGVDKKGCLQIAHKGGNLQTYAFKEVTYIIG